MEKVKKEIRYVCELDEGESESSHRRKKKVES